MAEVALEGLTIHLLHRAVNRADEIFASNVAETNLTPRQYPVLVGIAKHGDLSQSALSEMTGSDRTTLGEVVRRLLKTYCSRACWKSRRRSGCCAGR